MRRSLITFAGVVLLAAMTAGPVAASQTERGTPGLPNCMGQTTAYETHVLVPLGAKPGLGNFVKAWNFVNGTDISVTDLKAQTHLIDCPTP